MRSLGLLKAIDMVIEVAASRPTADYYWARLKSAPSEGHVTISHIIDANEECRRSGVVHIIDGFVELDPELLSLHDRPDRRLAILERIWSVEPPPWLVGPTLQVLETSMPDADREALAWTEAEAADREAVLLSLAQKVDSRRLEEMGAEVEAWVVAAYEDLLSEGGGSCEQLSLISDQLGYDLRVRTPRGLLRVEVKAAAGTQVLRFFLSRSEANAALRLQNWRLVICSHSALHGIQVAGHLQPEQLDGLLPTDPSGTQGSWETCRIVVPTDQLSKGLPMP